MSISSTTTTNTDKNHCSLQLDQFIDSEPNKIRWPLMGIILGCSQSGKTTLMSNILDHLDTVYSFSLSPSSKKTLVAISPQTNIEMGEKMKTAEEWEIIQYSSEDFSETLVSVLRSKFKAQDSSLNILVIDDTGILALQNKHMRSCLNNIYASFRHLNVSVWSMLHTYHNVYRPMIENAGIIIIMFSATMVHDLRRVLSQTFFKGTAQIVRDLKTCLIDGMDMHDYIVVNKSKEALSGTQFYITNSIFNPKQGITIRQFLN